MQYAITAAVFSLAVGLVGIVYGASMAAWVLRRGEGSERMKEISRLIAEGAWAFLKREYITVLPIGAVLAALVGLAYYVGFHYSATMALLSATSFSLGAIGSAVAGYVGMYVTTRSASRTANSAVDRGLGGAFSVSFRAGSVMGAMLASVAIVIISALFIVYTSIYGSTPSWAEALIPTAFGASLLSLFIRVAGGIYTKAADWGADIVGKVEAGIPEDDPRNPGVIADNVGDNVGDVAGMSSDVYESLVVVLTGSMFLGAVFRLPEQLVLLPMVIAGSALLGTLIGMQVARGSFKGPGEILSRLNLSLYIAVALTLVINALWAVYLLGGTASAAGVLISDLLGMLTAIIVLHITEYYTHYTHGPVRTIARQATVSASNVIVTGYSYGLESAIPIILTVSAVLGLSFWIGYSVISTSGINSMLSGIYSTAIASTGLLSLAGMIITLDSFGPVSDNASGLAEMAELPPNVRESTDALDAIGNTTKATTKGYAIASAGLAALVLFIGFVYEVFSRILGPSSPGAIISTALQHTSVMEPDLLIGAFLGAALVYMFSSRTLRSVSRTAMELVEEIRRQFRERPGILEGKESPDYSRAIDIVTRHALGEFMLPGLMAVIVPVIVGLILGWVALVGLILGTIVVGFPRALLMANSGGAWDNAKKYIEANYDRSLGGKGSEAHRNAVVGDVVGDPFKDTTGPSLNPLIKVVNTVSIVFAAAIAYANVALHIQLGLFQAIIVLIHALI